MFKYPYGNKQQLNLNWFITKFKELLAAWEDEKADIDGALQDEIDRAEAALSDVFDARDIAVAAKNDAVDAKTDAVSAKNDAVTAKVGAETAKAYANIDALRSEGWAVGEQNNIPVASDSPYYENSAKYYKQQADADATATAADRVQTGLDRTATGNDATATAADALKAEGYASGTQNGTPVTSGSPYYQNNSAYYRQEAEDAADAADTFKDGANSAALRSEGYAIGKQNGTPVASVSPYYQNNAEYYKDLAEAAASGADGSAAQAMIAEAEATSTASAPHATGTFFRLSGVLYVATSDIAIGDTITAGTNCKVAVIGDELTAQSDRIDELKSSTDDIEKEVREYNSENILDYATKTTQTINHVDFTANADGSFTVVGTASALANKDLINSTTSLPEGIESGKTYYVRYSATDVILRIIPYVNGSSSASTDFKSNGVIALPNNLTGIIIRLVVNSGKTVSETVNPKIFNSLSNDDLLKEINKTYTLEAGTRLTSGTDLNNITTVGNYFTLSSSDTIYHSPVSGTTFALKVWKSNSESITTLQRLQIITEPFTVYERRLFNGAWTEWKSIDQRIQSLSNTVDSLTKVNKVDLFKSFPPTYTNDTSGEGDIEFQWSADKNSCYVSGTATTYAANILYYNTTALPQGLAAGHEYYLKFDTTDSDISIYIIYYANGSSMYGEQFFKSGYFYLPENCSGFLFRIQVNGSVSGTVVDGWIRNIIVTESDIPENAPYIITFKDDDASADDYVTKYHDSCMHNGIRGCYAVLTDKIEAGYTTAAKLLEYEDEGFTMLTHGYSQGDDSPWAVGTLDEKRADLSKALRMMRSNGFVNYNFWQTPYGINDTDNFNISLSLGLDCTVASVSVSGINRYGNSKKFGLDTVSLSPNSVARAKERIDELIQRGHGGWLIITTHFYDWTDETYDTTLDDNGYAIGYSKFNEVAQYALESGAEVLSFANAWETFESYMKDKTASH